VYYNASSEIQQQPFKDLFAEKENQKEEESGAPIWCDPFVPDVSDKKSSGFDVELMPRISPMLNLPIETQDLILADEETGVEEKVGVLRFWVDIFPSGADKRDVVLAHANVEFEVRITIRDISGIAIFKDFGERNDVLVKGTLHSKSSSGTVRKNLQTDCHKYANDKASFNWQWVFRVASPANYCYLNLEMVDYDRVSNADPIYEAKQLNLDHLLMLSYHRHLDSKRPLGEDHRTIVFDSWAEERTDGFFSNVREASLTADAQATKIATQGPRRCYCCCRKSPKKNKQETPPGPARMKVDIKILPVNEVAGDPAPPVLTGTAESGRIFEPKGRIDTNTMLADPMGFFTILIGKKNKRFLYKLSICTFIILIILIFLVLSYLLWGTYGDIALKIWDNHREDNQ
jgi:hypothetical protein